MRTIIFTITLLALAACGASAVAADPAAAGGRMFLIHCGGCHAISAAGPNSLGPRLDAIVARAKSSPDPAAWLRRAITNPAAETAPGYQPGLMPLYYGQTFTPAELNSIVTYMLKVGGT
ncbi:MAG: c-type cytochrome [Chloroflexales bacterium]